MLPQTRNGFINSSIYYCDVRLEVGKEVDFAKSSSWQRDGPLQLATPSSSSNNVIY